MADPILLLTPLRKTGHNFKAAIASGAWVPISGTLGELGKALDVDEAAQVDVVRSTPDPWAQARSFADAVLNPSTLLRHKIEQWRGLLALFGLSAVYEDTYKVTLTAVPLGERNSRFAQVMKHLLPQVALPAPAGDVSHGWDRPIIVHLAELDRDHRPNGAGYDLGLLNPACLVATSRDAEKVRIASIPWLKDGLTDPVRLSGSNALPPNELQMLARFLDNVDHRLEVICRGAAGPGETVLGAMRREIKSFADDCRAIAGGAAAGQALELEDGDVWADGLPALYQILATPVKAKAPEPGTSECIIRLRDDLGDRPPFKGLVLLDPGLATADRPASRITFWGHKRLNQALRSTPGEMRALREEIAASGFLLVTPDDIFTRVLVRLDDNENPGRIGAHKDEMTRYLLPLSPLALLVRNAGDLGSAVSIDSNGKVSLRLTVGGFPAVVARRYTEKPQGEEGQLLCEIDWGLGDFAFWPDFRSEAWKHYFARMDYATNSIGRLRGRFALSGQLFADVLRETQSDEARAERVSSWVDSAPLDNRGSGSILDRISEFQDRTFSGPALTRIRGSNSGGRASEMQSSPHPFEAAFYTIAMGGDQPPVPAGLTLLSLPELMNPHDNIGRVAIDFGTTNTVACLNDTKPIVLKARIVHPVTPALANPGNARAFELTQKFRDFMPSDPRELPTPTVIIDRPLDTAGRERLEIDAALNDNMLVRHLMYFQPDFAEDGTISAVPIAEWSALLNSIKYNLKWSRSPEMRDAARRYLRQLMLMIACEWVNLKGRPANLRWHFSRPKDMGDDPAFKGELQRALKGILDNPHPEAIRPITYEGDAAAAYILDEEIKGSGTKGAVNIILDIGGGTTDIAIWDNGAEPKQLLSASMRLAGGDFFTSHIIGNPEILEDFGLKPWASVIAALNRESDGELRKNLQYIGELLFSGKTLDQAIEREWSRISDTDNVRVLKETAYVFLGGVAWFVGRHLRNLIRDGQLPQDALGNIAVAFCGRGSGLFARLHGKDPRAQTAISRIMLLIAVAAGEGRPKFPQVQVSPVPKIEVAAGMIIRARHEHPDDPAPTDSSESGIDFFESDSSSGTMDFNAADDLQASALPLELGIEDLDTFLAAFGKVAGFKMTVNDDQRAKLVNGIADIDREDMRDGRPPQSEFAVMLKVLVGFVRLRPGDAMRPKTVWSA